MRRNATLLTVCLGAGLFALTGCQSPGSNTSEMYSSDTSDMYAGTTDQTYVAPAESQSTYNDPYAATYGSPTEIGRAHV